MWTYCYSCFNDFNTGDKIITPTTCYEGTDDEDKSCVKYCEKCWDKIFVEDCERSLQVYCVKAGDQFIQITDRIYIGHKSSEIKYPECETPFKEDHFRTTIY